MPYSQIADLNLTNLTLCL